MIERGVQVGNKGFLNTFIVVIAATLIFYGFSSIGALAISNTSSKNFGDQTYIGPFDVSRQKERAVRERLLADFTALQAEFAVNLTYQDVTIELPQEVVVFDIEKTIQQSSSGKENPIIATVLVEGLETVLRQQFSAINFTDESIQSIATGIEQELGTGIMPLTVHITDYSDFTETELAAASMPALEQSTSFKNLIAALNGTEIAPFSTFSLLDFIQTNETGPVSDDELSILATALYSTILQTNFVVDERNISTTFPSYADLGFEAAINKQLGLNFIFTNPNKTTFTLNMTSVGDALRSSITGMPFLYSYQPYIGNSESYEPKTVQQYSAFVSSGVVQIADEGQNGMEVNVHRTISYEGAVLVDEEISSDFYAPLPKIEIQPIIKETTQSSGIDSPDSENGTTGSGAVDLQGNSIPSTSSNTKNSEKQKKSPSNLESKQEQDENFSEEDTEVQYDKGGNIVK